MKIYINNFNSDIEITWLKISYVFFVGFFHFTGIWETTADITMLE